MKPPPKHNPLFSISPTLPDTPNCNNLHAPSDHGITGTEDPPPELPPLPALPAPPLSSPTLPGQGRSTDNTPSYCNIFKYIGKHLPGRLIGASPLFGSSPADSTVTGLTDANVLAAAAAKAALDASAFAAGGDDIVGGGDDGLIQNDHAEANEVEFVHQPNPYYDEEESLDNSFWEDINECGDGGDSDEEGPVAGLISDAALAKTVLSTTGEAVGSEDDSIDEVGEPSAVAENVTNTGASVSSTSLPGAPKKWEPPRPPISWLSYSSNDKKWDAPDEEAIDNPGNWNLYSY